MTWPMTGKELGMEHQQSWFAGIDWGSQDHQVHVSDAAGVRLGPRSFPHDGAGLAAMAEWILAVTGARPEDVAAALEPPHGPVVGSLMARVFRIDHTNPNQRDRSPEPLLPHTAQRRDGTGGGRRVN